MIQVGSGNNNSCELMDCKLLDEATRHNLKRVALIKGLDMVDTTDVNKLSCVRAMRRQCKLRDKYMAIPFPEDLPVKADPIGFEAMLSNMEPSDSDLLLRGVSNSSRSCMLCLYSWFVCCFQQVYVPVQ